MCQDPYILRSQLEQADRRIADLELLLAETRVHAVRWEQEAKSLRKEIQRLRMDCDTERIARE